MYEYQWLFEGVNLCFNNYGNVRFPWKTRVMQAKDKIHCIAFWLYII